MKRLEVQLARERSKAPFPSAGTARNPKEAETITQYMKDSTKSGVATSSQRVKDRMALFEAKKRQLESARHDYQQAAQYFLDVR